MSCSEQIHIFEGKKADGQYFPYQTKNLDRQLKELAGVSKVFSDKLSGQ